MAVARPGRATRVLLYSPGLMVGGLAPLTVGIIGIGVFIDQGYITSRAGVPQYGFGAVLPSIVVGLAGIALIAYAIGFYRRHAEEGPEGGGREEGSA